MAYVSCTACNVTVQLYATTLDDVTCQHCGGPVQWLVPPDPEPGPEPEPEPDFGSAEPSGSVTARATDIYSGSTGERQSQADALPAATDGGREVASTAPPSQDRSTRQISAEGDDYDDDEEEPSSILNRAVPELPQLRAPGSDDGDVGPETPDDAPPPPAPVLDRSDESGLGVSVIIVAVSLVAGGLLAWLLRII